MHQTSRTSSHSVIPTATALDLLLGGLHRSAVGASADFAQTGLANGTLSPSPTDYLDQIHWTSMAEVHNDSLLDSDPIGLIPIQHPNFTAIVKVRHSLVKDNITKENGAHTGQPGSDSSGTLSGS